MFGAIFAIFVVLGVFAVVVLLFSVYLWLVDPHQFASWRTTLRSFRAERGASGV